MCLENALMYIFINVHFSILLTSSKYPVGQEDKNRTCPVPSCYITFREESLNNGVFHLQATFYFLRLSPPKLI